MYSEISHTAIPPEISTWYYEPKITSNVILEYDDVYFECVPDPPTHAPTIFPSHSPSVTPTTEAPSLFPSHKPSFTPSKSPTIHGPPYTITFTFMSVRDCDTANSVSLSEIGTLINLLFGQFK